MTERYIELRKSAARGTDSIAADVMRHLHTRQHLGKAAVLCEQPLAMLAASRKQWLKLSRALQKQRAATLSADKILKYTHTITHMQHMRFSIKDPLEAPDADVYFISVHAPEIMPVHCYSTYLINPISTATAHTMMAQLPAGALIIDYHRIIDWTEFETKSKKTLEAQVDTQWAQVERFMHAYKINVVALMSDDVHNTDAMDDALDTLLGVSHKFLQVANEFQRALELARPLHTNKALRAQYDSLVLLAHRVQALSPGAFTQHFLETYNEDDTFFLYDAARSLLVGESLAAAYHRHTGAQRHHLAQALREYNQALSWPAVLL